MATTHRSDLVDRLEKALTEEAYDGGMGALNPEQFTALVRTLATTAAAVAAEARTPSDARYPEVDAFAERMRAEMVANAGKGDRWREMTLWQAWCEISWHIGKMTGAIKADDIALISELAADVANGALMIDVIAAGGAR